MWLLGLCQEVCPEGTDMIPGPATQKLAPKAIRGSTGLRNDQISMMGACGTYPNPFCFPRFLKDMGACSPHSTVICCEVQPQSTATRLPCPSGQNADSDSPGSAAAAVLASDSWRSHSAP